MTASTSSSALSTKTARHAKIKELIAHSCVRSQAELAQRLAEEGVSVTQGTLSRDLVELGAVRVRSAEGNLIYAVPAEGPQRSLQADQAETTTTARLAALCRDLLVSAQASNNLVVLRTPPGAAQFLASAIDQSGTPDILGTIAGDDTIMVIAVEATGGAKVAAYFASLTESRPTHSASR